MTTDEVIAEMDQAALLTELAKTRAALRDILPWAEYLRNAPHHPDIAKLDNAREILGSDEPPVTLAQLIEPE